jgi:hypothetical protein
VAASALMKARDSSAAWWRTPGGCAAAGDGAGRTVAASAVMKAQDSSPAWWRTPGGCATAGDSAGRTVAASAGMKARTCLLADDDDPGLCRCRGWAGDAGAALADDAVPFLILAGEDLLPSGS